MIFTPPHGLPYGPKMAYSHGLDIVYSGERGHALEVTVTMPAG